MKVELLNQLPAEVRLPVEQHWQALEDALADAKKRAEQEIKLLKEHVRLLLAEKYGVKSEKLSDLQMQLLNEEPGVAKQEAEGEAKRTAAEKEQLETAAKSKPRAHPGRNEFPAHLPRRENVIACAPEDCRCAKCGKETKVIGYDQSEELDIEPVKYVVNVNKFEKRACPTCPEAGVDTAPAPAKIIEKSKAANRLVVDVVVKKYADHLPLYRQAVILEREIGLELTRATLCGWVMKAGELMQAVSREMTKDLLLGGYIQADETRVDVHNKKALGKNHQAYLWEYSRPGGPVVFDFRMGRGREGPRLFLKDFAGILQSDGYSAYAEIGGPGLTHAGCMAHARREFVEALKVDPDNKTALAIVESIGALYAVEATAREQGLSAEQRLALRKEKSAPQLALIKEQIFKARKEALPKSQLGKACDYAMGQWPRLAVYAEHGEVEIDNNWCENAIRPLAVGRKNWLHIGDEEAGPRVAAIASVFETCRRYAINVRDYLNDVLPKLAVGKSSDVPSLTPMAWAKQKADTSAAAR